MAGDWIKMRVDLHEDPAVITIAAVTKLDRPAVIGRLHRIWSWADQQLRNGDGKSVTQAFLDELVAHSGFAQAMSEAGWLKILSTGVSFPNFDRHNGKPAKDRALTRDRMKRHRDAVNVTNASPEKRREEKIENPPSPLSAPHDSGARPGHEARPRPRANGAQHNAAAPSIAVDRTQERIAEQRAWTPHSPPEGKSPSEFLKGFIATRPTTPEPPAEPLDDLDA